MFKFFPLKPAPFCKLSAGLGNTNVFHSSSLLMKLLLCPQYTVLFSIFSFTSNSLAENCLLSLPYYQETPDTRFSWETMQLVSWPYVDALLLLSAVPCILSPLTSRIHSCHFSDWRRTVSSKFVSLVSNEKLVLPRNALSSSLQRTQPSVKLLPL